MCHPGHGRRWDPIVKTGHSAADVPARQRSLKSGTAADSGTAGSAAATAFGHRYEPAVPVLATSAVDGLPAGIPEYDTVTRRHGAHHRRRIDARWLRSVEGGFFGRTVVADDRKTMANTRIRVDSPALPLDRVAAPDGRVLSAGKAGTRLEWSSMKLRGQVFSPLHLF